jgi:hypothetical protein
MRFPVRFVPTQPVLALILLLGLTPACRDAKVDAARTLLEAFQSGCSTQSQWLQLAVDHNARLRQTVLTLKAAQKERCASADADLGLIASLSGNVESLLLSETQKDYLIADAQVRELKVALAQTPDTSANAEARAALAAALTSAEVELAIARASNKASLPAATLATQAQASLTLGTTLGSLLGETDKILSCASSDPSTAIQLATNLTAIGGSFISPVVGAGAAVIGQLLNVGTQAIREYPYEKALWELDSALMPTALTCGLESLTEFYCDAVDYQTLLHAEEDSFGKPTDRQHPVFEAIDILARKLAIFNDWLYKVQNGSDPQRRANADEKVKVEFKRTSVRTTRLEVTANFNEQRTLYRDTPEADRPNLLVNLVASLSKTLSGDNPSCIGGSCPTPFSTISKNPFEYACFLVLGVPTGNPLPPAFCPERVPTDTLEGYIQKPELLTPLLAGGIERIFSVWSTQIFPRVDALVQAEYTAIVIDDPAAVIDLATIDAQDRITPKTALSDILEFLESMTARYEGEPRYLEDTLRQLQETLLELALTDKDPKDRLTAIAGSLRLQIGPHLIQERIRNLVERDLDYQLEHGTLPSHLKDILRVTDGDLIDRLANEGSLNHRRIEDGVNEARKLTEGNIRFFREFFSKSYARAVEELDARAREAREDEVADPRFRANTQALARLCALLVVSGEEWPGASAAARRRSEQICSRSVYSNVYRDDSGQLLALPIRELMTEVRGRPEMDRLCAFHRKLRTWRLDEILRRSGERRRGRD